MQVRDMAVRSGIRFSSGGLPLLACPLIATAGDEAMEEFLEVCNQPVLDCMEVTVQRRDGKFYLPDIPGLPFRLDMKWLKKKRTICCPMNGTPEPYCENSINPKTGPPLNISDARSFAVLCPDLLYNYLFSCYICY